MPEPPPLEDSPPDLPEPEPPWDDGKGGSYASGSSGANGGEKPVSGAGTRATGGDGEIRDGQEVFEMARELFGPDGSLGGGQNGAG